MTIFSFWKRGYMSQYFTDESLKSNIVKHKVKILNTPFCFNTDNGVFAKSKIDFGTVFLLETVSSLNLPSSSRVLDVGCGYGVIGIVFAKVFHSSVDMVDVNKRAIHLTKMNLKENKVSGNVFESDAYAQVEGKYDVIVTNPPIRAGKKVVYSILFGAFDHLEENGSLYFVVRKNHGAKSIIKDLEEKYDVQVLDKSHGFFVIQAKKR